MRQLKLNILQVGRPSKSGLPFDMCRKLTAFLGRHIAYYNSAQRTPFLPSSSGALLSASGALGGPLPPPLRSNGGGGILPSGQNDGRGGNPPLLPPLHKRGFLTPNRRGRRPRRPASPSCQSTEPLSPFVIPTERSERRDLGTNSLVQEISPLGRCRFLGRNDRENACLHRCVAMGEVAFCPLGKMTEGAAPLLARSRGGGIFALAKMTEGEAACLGCSRGGGILPSGQNDGRGLFFPRRGRKASP